MDFAKLCIYGLLTDLIDVHFYSYDPAANKFVDETLVVNITRDVEFSDMIPGIYTFLHSSLTIDLTRLHSRQKDIQCVINSIYRRSKSNTKAEQR